MVVQIILSVKGLGDRGGGLKTIPLFPVSIKTNIWGHKSTNVLKRVEIVRHEQSCDTEKPC